MQKRNQTEAETTKKPREKHSAEKSQSTRFYQEPLFNNKEASLVALSVWTYDVRKLLEAKKAGLLKETFNHHFSNHENHKEVRSSSDRIHLLKNKDHYLD